MLTFLILGAIGGLIGAAAASVYLLYRDQLVQWFQERFLHRRKDPQEVAFSLKERLNNGEYKVVQGIFNQETEQVQDAKVWNAHELDAQLQQVHAHDELVVWQ